MEKVDENKTLNNKIRNLAPDAIEAMGDMLRDPHTPASTKAQLIGFVLERTLGKPDTTIHLLTASGSVEDSQKRLAALVNTIREETMNDSDETEANDETDDEDDSEEDSEENDETPEE